MGSVGGYSVRSERNREAFSYFNETQHGIGDGRTLLVTDLLDNWLQARQRRVDSGDLAPKTMELSVLAARHVRASLGTIVASELSVDAVEVFLSNQLERFSFRYVQLQRNVLDQGYKWAMRNRLLSWNPVTLSALPRGSNGSHGTVLTAEQVSQAAGRVEGWALACVVGGHGWCWFTTRRSFGIDMGTTSTIRYTCAPVPSHRRQWSVSGCS